MSWVTRACQFDQVSSLTDGAIYNLLLLLLNNWGFEGRKKPYGMRFLKHDQAKATKNKSGLSAKQNS